MVPRLAPGILVRSHYRLERRLASDGPGDVWLARDLRPPGRDVRLELHARAALHDHAAALARARALPDDVVLDHGLWEGGAYLAMDAVAGAPLPDAALAVDDGDEGDACEGPTTVRPFVPPLPQVAPPAAMRPAVSAPPLAGHAPPHEVTVRVPRPSAPPRSHATRRALAVCAAVLAFSGIGGLVVAARRPPDLHATAPAVSPVPAPSFGSSESRAVTTPRPSPRPRPRPSRPPAPAAPSPVRAPAPRRVAPAALPERLSRAQVAASLAPLAGAVRACARGQSGTATVTVLVGGHGRVLRATTAGAFAGTPEGDCIAGVVRGARFPPFRATQATVAWPYVVVARR